MLLEWFVYCMYTEIKCEDLDHPVGGTVTYDSVTPGSAAVYSCDQDHKLVQGSQKRICSYSTKRGASWSGKPPQCLCKYKKTFIYILGRGVVGVSLLTVSQTFWKVFQSFGTGKIEFPT